MPKRSIVFLTTHTSKGGTLDYLFALKRHFDKLGYVCSIVALRRGADHDARPEIEVLSTRGGAGTLLKATFRFFKLCVRNQPSVILGVMPLANVLAALGGALCGARAVATHHNPCSTHGRVVRVLDGMAGSAGLYRRIFCVSNSVALSFDHHSSRYKALIRVIRNGVPPIGASRHSTAEVKGRFGLSPELAMVLMIGRLSTEKNVLGVIEAIAAVDGAQLVLGGEGPMRSHCEALIQLRGLGDRVRLLGTVSKEDVGALLHASDVFVQVSHYEGNSLALLEAISAGATMVVSRVPAQMEAVASPDGSMAAVLCDPASISSIAQAIQAAAFDPLLRRRLQVSVKQLGSTLQTEDRMLLAYERELNALHGEFAVATGNAP